MNDKFKTELFNKPIAFASLSVAVLLMIALPKGLNPSVEPDNYALIKITALGQKSDSAKSSEVWISQVANAGLEIQLNSISLQKGWEDKGTALVSYQNQPNTLTVRIDDPKNPEITFNMHPWSGKVKIQEGKKTTIQDLYTTQAAQSFKYLSNVAVTQKKKYSPTEKIVISIVSVLALTVICYLFLLLAKIRNNFFLLNVILCFAVFFPSDYLLLTLPQKLLLLAISIGSCFIMQKTRANKFIEGYKDRTTIILAIPVILYAGFAFIGQRVFFPDYPLPNALNRIAYFLLFCSWLSFMGILFLYLTHLCKSKVANSTEKINAQVTASTIVKLYLIFGSIMLACWSFYLIAFFPGNMTPDSLDQWNQALGNVRYNDAHPVIHTLLIKTLISIWRNPAIISITQVLALAAVCSSFLVYLHRAGIPLKWLVIASLILGLIPANGVLPLMLWKDILFCTSVLWATLILTEILTEIYIFNYKTTIVFLAISLFAVALLRHNGTFAVIITVVFLLFWALKRRQKPVIIAVAVSVAGIIAYKKILLPHILKVPPVLSGFQLAVPMHGLAAVNYYGGDLSAEAKTEMEKLIPDSMWKSHYNPFNGDPYLFWTGTEYIKDLSKFQTSKVLKLYGNALIDNPFLVTRDRLNGSELLWDVNMAKGSFNYIFYTNIDSNKVGLKQYGNKKLKTVLDQFLEYTVQNLQPILWRPGIYNIMIALLLLSFFIIRKRYSILFLPLIGTNLSLVMAMTHQSFRYVYYIPLIFGFIWLLAISKAILPAKIKNTNTP